MICNLFFSTNRLTNQCKFNLKQNKFCFPHKYIAVRNKRDRAYLRNFVAHRSAKILFDLIPQILGIFPNPKNFLRGNKTAGKNYKTIGISKRCITIL